MANSLIQHHVLVVLDKLGHVVGAEFNHEDRPECTHTHEPLPAATPLESSAHMFERARDVIISGGQFYNAAGSTNIDASHNKHTSTNSVTSVTNLWHASNQIVNMGEKLDSQKEGSESDDRFRRTRSCFCEEATMHDGEGERHRNDITPFVDFIIRTYLFLCIISSVLESNLLSAISLWVGIGLGKYSVVS